MFGGVWQNFSAYQSFAVYNVRPGFWSGVGMEFYVHSPAIDGMYVVNFSIFVKVIGCGKYKITYPKALIQNLRFGFGQPYGHFSTAGAFSSLFKASGFSSLRYYRIPGCGTVSGGPFYWTATWKNSSQPPAFIPAEVAPLISDPQLEAAPDSYKVERVGP